MGQGNSSEVVKEDFTVYASQLELDSLNDKLGINNDKKLLLHDIIQNLRKAISEYFSKNANAGVLSTLQLRCRVASQPSAQIRQEICKLVFGLQHDRMSFIYEALSFNTQKIPSSNLKEFLVACLKCLKSHDTAKMFGLEELSAEHFGNCVANINEDIKEQEFHSFLQYSPFVAEIFTAGLRVAFFSTIPEISKDLHGSVPCLLPNIEVLHNYKLTPANTLLSISDVVYLNSHLPMKLQLKWRFLYSTKLQGESFSKLSSQMVNRGPLLFVVKDQEGHVFGGFVSTDLSYSAKFQGTSESFLFTLYPEFGVFNTSGINDHYAYFNTRQETMPNGFGMGGQHDYFGFWLSSEFGSGHSKGKPTCTTYKSPQLSASPEFVIDTLEAWGLGEEPANDEEEDEDGMTSVIDKHPDVVAILRVAGRERVSEGYRDNEMSTTMLESTEIHPSHDPMD